MKYLIIVLSSISFVSFAHADSIWLIGDKADAVVQPLLKAGVDPLGPKEHNYFQAGVVGCGIVFDEKGDYFADGKVGDIIGEACQIYGDIDGTDADGSVARKIMIPKEDRELAHSPAIKMQLEQNRAIREALEGIVIPITYTVEQNGHKILLEQTSGIGGIACDGRNKKGERVCQVLLSPKCPARSP